MAQPPWQQPQHPQHGQPSANPPQQGWGQQPSANAPQQPGWGQAPGQPSANPAPQGWGQPGHQPPQQPGWGQQQVWGNPQEGLSHLAEEERSAKNKFFLSLAGAVGILVVVVLLYMYAHRLFYVLPIIAVVWPIQAGMAWNKARQAHALGQQQLRR